MKMLLDLSIQFSTGKIRVKLYNDPWPVTRKFKVFKNRKWSFSRSEYYFMYEIRYEKYIGGSPGWNYTYLTDNLLEEDEDFEFIWEWLTESKVKRLWVLDNKNLRYKLDYET